MAIRNRRGGGENLNIVKAARETAATTKKILTAKKAAQNGAGFVPSTSESPVVSNVLQVVDGITNDDDSVVGKSEPEEGYVIDKVRLSSKRRDRLDVAFERADAEVDADAAVLNQKDNGSLNEAVVEIGQDMVVIDEPKITPVSGLTTPLETTEPKVTTAPPTTQSSAVAEVEPGLIEKQLLVELKMINQRAFLQQKLVV
ncbi:MAG: hypothetical protein NT091_00160 [Candidatus Falkowbacteria bacterium]|nr:hypothetical protein [Candidatus Falkowbacteria bacterium]